MREDIVRFWRGELPLGKSFWTYAILYGAAAHLAGLVLALVLHMQDAPIALTGAFLLLPTAFSVWALVGVWRSANRFRGHPFWADLAKMGAICWTIVGVAI